MFTKMHVRMFIVVLFIIAPNFKVSECSSPVKWGIELRCIHTMAYVIKRMITCNKHGWISKCNTEQNMPGKINFTKELYKIEIETGKMNLYSWKTGWWLPFGSDSIRRQCGTSNVIFFPLNLNPSTYTSYWLY